jgi:TPR repeat protein
MQPVTSLPPVPLEGPQWERYRQREDLRKAMLERRFEVVERTLTALETAWWQPADQAHDHYIFLAAGSGLFDYASTDADLRLELLNSWSQSYPGSYHARQILGHYYFRRACDIRTASWASNVGEDQWVGAHMACVTAAEHLLKAMTLSTRPALAAETMMQICQYLGQPDFVDDLFRGVPVEKTMQRDEFEPDLYEVACAQLARHGLKPPGIFSAVLPASVPPMQAGDMENPGYYWLRYCLALRPRWADILASYAQYLSPRWGGSDGEVEKFAIGPLCSALNEQERNSVRWPGIHDAMTIPDYPEPGDIREIKARQKIFENWLARDLSDHLRFISLGKYANFTAYSLADWPLSHQRHVESVRYCITPATYPQVDGPFRDFTNRMLIKHFDDTEGAYNKILQTAARRFDEPTMLTMAAFAWQFGMWGIEADPDIATRLIDRAAQLEPLYEPDEFTPMHACRMIWDGGFHKESAYLTRAFAERRVYSGAASLYDILRGIRPDTEPHLLDDKEADHWLEQAVEEGEPVALFNYAWRLENVDNLDLTVRDNFERVRSLYIEAMNSGMEIAAIKLASVDRRRGTEEEKQQAVAHMKTLITHHDDHLAGEAYGEVVLAYKYGDGVPKSEFIAMQWFDRFKELFPDHSSMEWMETQVYGSTGWQMAGRALRAFFLGKKLSAEHLPPK